MTATAPTEPATRRVAGRTLITIGDVALWVVAVLGACSLLLTLAAVLFAVRPLIFRSGSMAPTITAGSLALAHRVPADAVRVGDIVSVTTDDTRVTHRVISTRPDGDRTLLRLRGDANSAPDRDPYRVATVDKVWFAVPAMGYVISWLSRPPGVFVLAGYAAAMLALVLRRRPADDRDDDDDHDHRAVGRDDEASDRADAIAAEAGDTPDQRPDRPRRARRIRAAFGSLLVGGAAALSPTPSWATFTDRVPISGSSIVGYTVPTTSFSCGALGVASVTFNWTAVSGATSYTLHYGNAGASTLTTTATSYTVVTLINGGTAWVTVNRDFGSVTWSSVASTKRTYTVAVVSLCS
ncbi:signal peptidase I [Microlunatus soli]|uniref:Signal peptidase I n=1 Tax=Microlunatus soli TaxID=630515 RepID=A0A1H1VJH0_9ACTN|nr:signal peptidase I [Microlunatus soli]SDS84491.1 signal peptidase I [Microlunatus soli]